MVCPRNADTSRIPLDAKKIRELRKAMDLTLTELAKRARLPSAQHLSDIEHGRRANLTIGTLDRIAAALEVRARDLLK
jgi:transcriptional regulator with XRE-family HTH domain